MKVKHLSVFIWLIAGAIAVSAQTTEFTYQGKLSDGASAANANYDFEFRLFDVISGGTALGTVSRLNVPVTSGIFTVRLDFGAQFTGASRFLEIAVRPAGSSGGYQQLLPRQPMTSAPYAIRALSAAAADTATDAQNLNGQPAGSFIRNQTATAQTADFNISGSGAANTFNATQYNIGGNRVLSVAGTQNLFVGFNAGTASDTSFGNSFIGDFAGSYSTGNYNSFVGSSAGSGNTTGGGNSFFGGGAGFSNATGSNNTMIGYYANSTASNLTYATAIGSGAEVSTSNSIVLGRSSPFFDTDNVGIGTASPLSRLHVRGNVFVGLTQNPNIAGGNALFLENDSGSTNNKFRIDAAGNFLYIIGTSNAGASAGAGIIFRTAPAGGGESDRVIINSDGTVKLNNLGDAGTPQSTLCRNNLGAIAFCSSSRRYKTNVEPYQDGLNLINRLKPVSFNWKTTDQADIGLIAEEVAEVEPRLAYKNPNGEVEGVSYSQMSVVLINAVKEQQTQIERLREQNKQLRQQFEQLIKTVCAVSREAEICQEKTK